MKKKMLLDLLFDRYANACAATKDERDDLEVQRVTFDVCLDIMSRWMPDDASIGCDENGYYLDADIDDPEKFQHVFDMAFNALSQIAEYRFKGDNV